MSGTSGQFVGADRHPLPTQNSGPAAVAAHPHAIHDGQPRKRWLLRFLISIADHFIAPAVKAEPDLLKTDKHRSFALQALSFLLGLPVLFLYFRFEGEPQSLELIGLFLFILTPVAALTLLRLSADLEKAATVKLLIGLIAQHVLCLGSGGLLSVFAVLPLLIQASISSYGNPRLILLGTAGSLINYGLLFGLQNFGTLPGSIAMPLPILAVSCLCYALVSIGLYIIASDSVRARTIVLQQLDLARRENAAIGETLRTISQSNLNVESILNMLGEAGRILCDASFAAVYLLDGRIMVPGAVCLNEGDARLIEQAYGLSEVDERSAGGRAIATGETVSVADILIDGGETDIQRHATTGLRSLLAVPLKKDGTPIGVMVLGRTLPRRFSNHEVALVESFSIQAVIAIETARRLEGITPRLA